VQSMNIKKPRCLERTVIYMSSWLDLFCDRVELPTGKILEKHHILDFHYGFVGAVVENDKDEILMVHVFRYPLDSLEWEIPTGRMEEGEDPIQAAQREVLEESGYDILDPRLRYSFHPINGISDKMFHVIACRAGLKVGAFDRDEINDVKWIKKETLRNAIKNRRIKDGFTLTALLLCLNDGL
jgi:ADP-ribose pyrophosphatase